MSSQTRAACRDADPELFFPPSTNDSSKIVAAHVVAVRPICEACPVARECLRWALDNGEDYGLWAATTPTERRAIRRSSTAQVGETQTDGEAA